jgi:hypothetical protein
MAHFNFRYVLFLSGLEFDSDVSHNEGTCMALIQLIDWIHGGSSDAVWIKFFKV